MTEETREYRVTGTQEVLGHEPGEEFEAALDPEQEETLLASGALTRTSDIPESPVGVEPEADAEEEVEEPVEDDESADETPVEEE